MSAQQNQLKDLTEDEFTSFSSSYSYKPVSFDTAAALLVCIGSAFNFGLCIPECLAVPGSVQSRGRDCGRASGQQ